MSLREWPGPVSRQWSWHGTRGLDPLSVLLYRILTGRPAFSGPSIPAIMHLVTTTMPPSPSELAEISEDFDLFFAIGMAKDPSNRFSSAEEMHRAFRAIEKGTVGEELRTRGEALIAQTPWGLG